MAAGWPWKPEFEGYKIQVAIDSGAAASVMPERLLTGHTVEPGEAFKRGTRYLAADGGRIPNLGEVEVGFFTKEQRRCRIRFQVAAVKRPLLAVSTLTKAGNDVYFGVDGGRIVNRQTKRVIKFDKVDGIYVLDILMAPPKGRRSPGEPAPAGMPSEWKTVQSKRTVRQNKQPQKPAPAGVSAATVLPQQGQSKGVGGAGSSGFTRPGA